MTNIHEVKARLSEYLDAVATGERVVICNRNRPVAELRAIASAPSTPRPVGGAKGRLVVPPAFFEQLPEEILEAFDDRAAAAVNRAAERPSEYRPGQRKRRTR